MRGRSGFLPRIPQRQCGAPVRNATWASVGDRRPRRPALLGAEELV